MQNMLKLSPVVEEIFNKIFEALFDRILKYCGDWKPFSNSFQLGFKVGSACSQPFIAIFTTFKGLKNNSNLF